ncbi:uncharacterized protein LOC128922060 [Zeugodacus cucurbitae]|uniref:uncharacterized protein LOC128922060 n=1 Tax=Zeugodacus cucurbitae TaxID=28588 RepID=UPI0023D91FA5|nr:uncharacterized protein LOC128922060 [Zeugodacus cucurbitae]
MSKRSYMMINDENSPPRECEEEVKQMKNLICELHVKMDKLLDKAFPKSTSLDIFPIKSVEEMEHFEENAEMFPKKYVICSIKECIDSTPITKSTIYHHRRVLVRIQLGWAAEEKIIKKNQLIWKILV